VTTISDVAKRAGVSAVTVSRVINNSGYVSPTTRAKVMRAIEELGYVPSSVAQSLRSKRTRTLALIVPDIRNAFWTTVSRGVEDAAQSREYSVFLCNTDENPAKQRTYLDVVVSQRVDGVIIAPYDSDAASLEPLRRRGIPTVVVDRPIEGWDVDTVSCDSISGARALVKHLLDLGHTRIAVVSGPAGATTARDRVIGYRIAMAEAGVPVHANYVKFGEFLAISGERLTHQLLDEDPRPTAIFAANNAIAMGVADALRARGLSIPQDMALVCFDDLSNCSRLFPFLTTVVQPAYDIGANATQLLLSRLESEQPPPPRRVVLPTRLVVRSSCGSLLKEGRKHILTLEPLESPAERVVLVKSLSEEERRRFSALIAAPLVASVQPARVATEAKPDVQRILKTLRGEQPDRIPHFELEIRGEALFERVLQRKPALAPNQAGALGVAPQDQVALAQYLGIDAIACHCNRTLQPGIRRISSWADLENLPPPPALADQLNRLERYLTAAQDTGVGIFVRFDSFFESAFRAIKSKPPQKTWEKQRSLLERLLDILLEREERMMSAVCDRFADDIAFVLIRDNLADENGPLLPLEWLQTLVAKRMKHLLAPAKAHGKPLAIHTKGAVESLLPMFREIGFHIVHPVEPESNDLTALKAAWSDAFTFAGGFPISLLREGDIEAIEARVRKDCERFASGGYIFGATGPITEDIPPEAFVAMNRALREHGSFN